VTDLQGTNLYEVDLRGVALRDAILQGAINTEYALIHQAQRVILGLANDEVSKLQQQKIQVEQAIQEKKEVKEKIPAPRNFAFRKPAPRKSATCKFAPCKFALLPLSSPPESNQS
jgi:hypothetical protein